MRRRIRMVVVPALLLIASSADARQTASPTLSPADYVAQLDRLASDVGHLDEHHPQQFEHVIDEVPHVWRVATPERTFDVPGEWVRTALNDWRRTPDAAARTRVADQLRMLRVDAASLQAPAPDTSQSRARLTGILANREFRDVHGPTWLDRLGRRILELLVKLLQLAMGSSAMSTVTNVLVYALVLVAVVVITIVLHRSLRPRAALTPMHIDQLPTSPKPWETWLADARIAAANGDSRQAIRFAYWCGIAFLEGQRAWKPDPSRTPREYLRVLPPSSEHLPSLTALSRLLERVWYGAAQADAAQFDEALDYLKTLGCPSR